jgi:hypothetical protein
VVRCFAARANGVDDPRIGMELRALLPRTYNLKAIADPVGSPCAELMVDKPEV